VEVAALDRLHLASQPEVSCLRIVDRVVGASLPVRFLVVNIAMGFEADDLAALAGSVVGRGQLCSQLAEPLGA
jgi:hypothetical protein